MKKKILIVVIGIILTAALLAGCGKDEDTAAAEKLGELISDLENAATQQLPSEAESDITAEQAYMDFLQGSTVLTTAESFRADDDGYNNDGLLYGAYSYAQLKAAVAQLEGQGSVASYALLDMGQDGVNELALRFDSAEPGFTNWVGVIRYDAGELYLNDYYEDGGRTFSTLYENGYLLTGGAISAGAEMQTLTQFDAKGYGTDLFTEKWFYGPFANNIVYDLRADGSGLSDDYWELPGESAFIVCEYLAGNTVKIAVYSWDEDPAAYEKEQALIDELVALGAELIPDMQMDALRNLAAYESGQVVWQEWQREAGTASSNNNGESFVLTVYSDANAADYPAVANGSETLNNAADIPFADASEMCFTCSIDGAAVALQYGEWDFERNEFVPRSELFSVNTAKDRPYRFYAFLAETMPYYRLVAQSGASSAEWLVLPDMKDGATTFTVKAADTEAAG